MEMTLIAALEKIAELNDYEDILVQDNAGEPQTIESAIEDIRRNAEDPEEERDYSVTVDSIRDLEDGYIKAGEVVYKVVRAEREEEGAEEVPGMTALKLMQQVAECQADDWQNSDMWPRDEAELEIIATHFQSCEECRTAFDAQEYPEETIQEFASIHTMIAEDWICQKAEVPLPSEQAWEKIEALKTQIETWDCEDVGALRGLIEQATEALRSYNEKYPSGAGPGKLEGLIDYTSLPSAELPEDLAEHTNYPIWTCDKSGACLVGAGAVEIETTDDIREALNLPLNDEEEEKKEKEA